MIEMTMPEKISQAKRILNAQAMFAKPSEYGPDEQFMLDEFSLRVSFEEAQECVRQARDLLSAPTTLDEALRDYAMFGKFVAELFSRKGNSPSFVYDWMNRKHWPEYIAFVKEEIGK